MTRDEAAEVRALIEQRLAEKSHIDKMREEEKQRLWNYPTAPYPPPRTDRSVLPTGVLLSDEIEFYCQNYKLVDPYEPKNLMAASYELRVGDKYAIGKTIHTISRGGVLEIPKFEVMVIEILETINMPDFLIGRWNIRTRWAYAGLIWVGGPQVNPGYRGRIMCPLWNLSNRPIKIPWGEAIAVMDFVTTTPPTESSNRRPLWHERTRFVFEEYVSGDLRSGLVTDAVEKIVELDSKSKATRNEVVALIDASRNRVDNVTSIMFTALGVLVAAIAIFATKPPGPDGSPQYWWEPTVFFLALSTTALTLLAWLRSPRDEGKWSKSVRITVGVLAVGVIALQLYHDREQSRASKREIQELTKRVESLESAVSGAENHPHPFTTKPHAPQP